MPSCDFIELLTAMLSTVSGWIILISIVVFFIFLGFKIFVGTHAERLLEKVVIQNHRGLMSAFSKQTTALQGVEKVLSRLI